MKYISLYFLNPDIEKKIVTYFGEEENVIIKIAIFKKIMLETEFYLPIKSLNDILNLKHHSSIQKKVANINNKAKDLINNILLTYKTNYSRKTMMDINLHNFNEVVKKILGKEDFDLPYPDNEARGLQMSLYLILTNPIIECQLLNLLGIKETNLLKKVIWEYFANDCKEVILNPEYIGKRKSRYQILKKIGNNLNKSKHLFKLIGYMVGKNKLRIIPNLPLIENILNLCIKNFIKISNKINELDKNTFANQGISTNFTFGTVWSETVPKMKLYNFIFGTLLDETVPKMKLYNFTFGTVWRNMIKILCKFFHETVPKMKLYNFTFGTVWSETVPKMKFVYYIIDNNIYLYNLFLFTKNKILNNFVINISSIFKNKYCFYNSNLNNSFLKNIFSDFDYYVFYTFGIKLYTFGINVHTFGMNILSDTNSKGGTMNTKKYKNEKFKRNRKNIYTTSTCLHADKLTDNSSSSFELLQSNTSSSECSQSKAPSFAHLPSGSSASEVLEKLNVKKVSIDFSLFDKKELTPKRFNDFLNQVYSSVGHPEHVYYSIDIVTQRAIKKLVKILKENEKMTNSKIMKAIYEIITKWDMLKKHKKFQSGGRIKIKGDVPSFWDIYNHCRDFIHALNELKQEEPSADFATLTLEEYKKLKGSK